MNILNLITKSSLKDFIILWVGQSLSKLGSSMTTFALIIWVYKTQNTALSAMLLSVFSYVPFALVSFFAGAIIDRVSKKLILFLCDSICVLCILIAFIMLTAGNLQVWHLYVINFISGFMLAFQSPAIKVSGTIILHEKYYTKANGLISISDSIITVATPTIGAFILSSFGINVVLILDILSFIIAFSSLMFFVNIPNEKANSTGIIKTGITKEALEGFAYLKGNKELLNIIIFMAGINFIAFMTYLGILPVMILARTSNNVQILGIVECCGGVGAIIGGLIITIFRPPKKLIKVTFIMCAVSFLISDMLLAVGNNVIIWGIAAFLGDLPIPFVNAYQNSFMQSNIPVNIQGRIFSIQGTLQCITIPIGYFMGGYLADKVFEPLMKNSSQIQFLLGNIVGTEHGSGMAIMFICSSILGCLISFMACRNKYIKEI